LSSSRLYGQAWNLLVGQTFSNFMDIDAFPDVVDYEGPNGLVNKRQPQIRYTQPFFDTKLQLALRSNNPTSKLTQTTPFTVLARALLTVPLI
jgi:hypothetical protein